MTTRLSAEILQSCCRRLEMMTDAPQHWQADSVYLQPANRSTCGVALKRLYVLWCSSKPKLSNVIKGIPKRVSKYPSTALRCGSSTNAGHEESHRTGLVGVEPPAVLHACVIRIFLPL